MSFRHVDHCKGDGVRMSNPLLPPPTASQCQFCQLICPIAEISCAHSFLRSLRVDSEQTASLSHTLTPTLSTMVSKGHTLAAREACSWPTQAAGKWLPSFRSPKGPARHLKTGTGWQGLGRGWELVPIPCVLANRRELCTWFSLDSGFATTASVWTGSGRGSASTTTCE